MNFDDMESASGVGNMPSGYRFSPSKITLINYLKDLSKSKPPNEVIFRDLYSGAPWDIFKDQDPWVDQTIPGKKSIYVCTKLKYLKDTSNPGKKKYSKTRYNSRPRFNRKAGCGSWHGESCTLHIVHENTKEEVGQMVKFSYRSNDNSKEGMKGHWTMEEYSLKGDSTSETIWVICKITRHEGKSIKIKRVDETKANSVKQSNPMNKFARDLKTTLTDENKFEAKIVKKRKVTRKTCSKVEIVSLVTSVENRNDFARKTYAGIPEEGISINERDERIDDQGHATARDSDDTTMDNFSKDLEMTLFEDEGFPEYLEDALLADEREETRGISTPPLNVTFNESNYFASGDDTDPARGLDEEIGEGPINSSTNVLDMNEREETRDYQVDVTAQNLDDTFIEDFAKELEVTLSEDGDFLECSENTLSAYGSDKTVGTIAPPLDVMVKESNCFALEDDVDAAGGLDEQLGEGLKYSSTSVLDMNFDDLDLIEGFDQHEDGSCMSLADMAPFLDFDDFKQFEKTMWNK